MTGKSSLTAWERWELASFDELADTGAAATGPQEQQGSAGEKSASPEFAAVPPAPTYSADEIESLRAKAHSDGFAEGRDEGLTSGHEEGLRKGAETGKAEAAALGREQAERLAAIITRLDQQIRGLEQSVADDLLALALEIAGRVIRQIHEVRPEVVVETVREALGQLAVQHAAVHLHPEDASLVRLYAGEQLGHAGHRIHENSSLERGDVVLEGGGSHLDATVATRWRRVLETLGAATPWIGATQSEPREPELPFSEARKP